MRNGSSKAISDEKNRKTPMLALEKTLPGEPLGEMKIAGGLDA